MATIIIKDKNLVPENIKDGVTILKVTGTYEGGGGTEINNQNKTVDASTVQQIVTADASYTGLGSVTVNEYELDSKTINPSVNQQTVTSSKDGLSAVTVRAVTSSIDSNIQEGNIKKDVTILGVTGTLDPSADLLEVFGTNPSTNTQMFGPSNWLGHAGVRCFNVYAVDASIDSNIQPENIREGVTILGVQGTLVDTTIENQKKTVTPRRTLQKVTADSGYTGMDEVTVYGVDSSIDSNIVPNNIKSGVTILGVQGTYGGANNDRAFPKGFYEEYEEDFNVPGFYDTIFAFSHNLVGMMQANIPDASISTNGKWYPTYNKTYERMGTQVMVIGGAGPLNYARDPEYMSESMYYTAFEASDYIRSFFVCNTAPADSSVRFIIGNFTGTSTEFSTDLVNWTYNLDITGMTTNVYFRYQGYATFKIDKANDVRYYPLLQVDEMEPMPDFPEEPEDNLCPDCGGSGETIFGTCQTCGGTGYAY